MINNNLYFPTVQLPKQPEKQWLGFHSRWTDTWEFGEDGWDSWNIPEDFSQYPHGKCRTNAEWFREPSQPATATQPHYGLYSHRAQTNQHNRKLKGTVWKCLLYHGKSDTRPSSEIITQHHEASRLYYRLPKNCVRNIKTNSEIYLIHRHNEIVWSGKTYAIFIIQEPLLQQSWWSCVIGSGISCIPPNVWKQ